MSKKAAAWFLLALCCICAGVLYGRGIDNYLVSDDWIFVLHTAKAETALQVATLVASDTGWFVRPTQWLVTWLAVRLAGPEPAAFHVLSAAIDVANAVLLGLLAYRLFGVLSGPRQTRRATSIAVSMLFLFSWRHHEVVFWYSSINELLAALFRLSALLLILIAIHTGRRTTRIVAVCVALGALTLALFSKESAVAFPAEVAALLALDCVCSKAGRAERALRVALFASCLLLVALWATLYVRLWGGGSPLAIERNNLTILRAPISNLILRFLQYFNGNFVATGIIERSIPLMGLELAILGALCILAIMRRRYVWVFALIWTGAAVTPYALTVPVAFAYREVPVLSLGIGGDRFLYYSAAGASLLMVTSAQWVVGEIETLLPHGRLPGLARPVAALGLLAIAGLNAGRMMRCEADWDRAGDIASSIVTQVQELIPQPETGSTVCIHSLPDNYNGRYIFRNGIAEALHIAYARHDFVIQGTTGECLDETRCSDTLTYDEATATVIRGEETNGALAGVPATAPLIIVDPLLSDQVLLGADLVTPWPVEDFGPDEQGFLWVGHGADESLAWTMWSDEQREILLRLDVTPGPGRDDARRTIELIVEGGGRRHSERRSFAETTSLDFAIELLAGRSVFRLVALDEATIPVQPNGDTRSLIVGLREVGVLSVP